MRHHVAPGEAACLSGDDWCCRARRRLLQLKPVFTCNMACICFRMCGKHHLWRLCSMLAGMQCSSLHTAAPVCLLPDRQKQSLLSLLQTLVVEALWPKLSAPVQVRAALAHLGAMACLRCHQDGSCQHSGTAQLHCLVAPGNDDACTTSMRGRMTALLRSCCWSAVGADQGRDPEQPEGGIAGACSTQGGAPASCTVMAAATCLHSASRARAALHSGWL